MKRDRELSGAAVLYGMVREALTDKLTCEWRIVLRRWGRKKQHLYGKAYSRQRKSKEAGWWEWSRWGEWQRQGQGRGGLQGETLNSKEGEPQDDEVVQTLALLPSKYESWWTKRDSSKIWGGRGELGPSPGSATHCCGHETCHHTSMNLLPSL